MSECEFPDKNPTTDETKNIFAKYKVIAIVGLSDDPEKDSNKVAKYLMQKGYNIIPVNPTKKEILGLISYPDLKSIPQSVDIVDIFRKSEAIPAIVDEAMEIGAKVVWMQLGLSSNASAQKARNAGLEVVQSKCIMQEHKKI